jgi:hypothetical protein
MPWRCLVEFRENDLLNKPLSSEPLRVTEGRAFPVVGIEFQLFPGIGHSWARCDLGERRGNGDSRLGDGVCGSRPAITR